MISKETYFVCAQVVYLLSLAFDQYRADPSKYRNIVAKQSSLSSIFSELEVFLKLVDEGIQ